MTSGEYYREPVKDALVLAREGLGELRSRTLNRTRAACYLACGGTGLLGPPTMHPQTQSAVSLRPGRRSRMPQEPVSPTYDLVRGDDEYRQLEAQHHEYESRLGELAEKAVLSDEEQVEETTLKKKKLQVKDRMQEIARRSRGAAAHP